MSLLILEPSSHLHVTQAPWSFVLSNDGASIERSGQAPTSLLPLPSKGTQVVLVLPAQELSWHRITLPQVSLKDRQRLRVILQGLLEDQLLDDPALLHFALAPDAKAGQACWVAACRADRLEALLKALHERGIEVQRIVPAFAPQDAQTNAEHHLPKLFALGTEEAPWLVITHASADGGLLSLPLTAGIQALDVVAALSHDTPVQAEPGTYQLASQRLARPTQLLESAQRLLQSQQTDWSLAQFQFANSGRDKLAQGAAAAAQALWRSPQWRWARWGAAALVLIQIIGVNVWAWQAKQDLAQQREQINQIFRNTFPKVPVVVDAPLQMQQELRRLQQQSGALSTASWEILAGDSGSQLPPSIAPNHIQFEDGQLSLTGIEPQNSDVQAWLEQLRSNGYLPQWQDQTLIIQAASQRSAP